ncbi:MAG: class I SAM-dependent methyltransferase [Patescibacteria group bacterium]
MDYRDFQKLHQTDQEHFWYKARRILINNLLSAALSTKNPDQKIIEIGCGTGIQLPLLAQFGTVEGLDIVSESVELVKRSGFLARVFNIETDSLGKDSTDVIACFDVLEHIKDDTSALKKIAETLKPNGILLFSVPAGPWLFGPHDRAASHYRRYSQKEIVAKIEASGLTLKTIGYWNSWLFPAIALMRIIKKIINRQDKASSDTKPLPGFINYSLYQILAAETKLGFKLPWGLSLYGYAFKK